MKKILFPTDFSKAANNAFVYALQFANQFQAEIVVLHQYDLPTIHVGGLPSTLKDVYDTIELETFENFKSQIPALHQIAKEHQLDQVKISNVLKHGDLIYAIQELIKEDTFDFIIMGTKGASGLKEMFLGSNAGAVISEVESVVVAVPEESAFNGLKKIVFTTRFREKDRLALQKVLKIANALGAQVHLVHVENLKNIVDASIVNQWKDDFEGLGVVFHQFQHENTYQTILNFIDSYEVDMVAMLHYKKGFFQELFQQSLTQKLSYHSKIPVLSIHEKVL